MDNKTAWTIHSPATWLTVSSYAGTGTTTLQLTVAENVTPGDRSAEVLLGQQGVRITQSGGNNTVPAVFEKASFRLPSAMTCIAPGQWSSETATTLCELKVASAPGFVDLNSIETGNSGANARLLQGPQTDLHQRHGTPICSKPFPTRTAFPGAKYG